MKITGRLNPPLLYQFAIVLMVIFHFLFPIATIISFPLNFIGIAVFILGAWIAVRAKRLFQKTNTPIKPTDIPVFLHKDDVFHLSRNPMYFGIFIALIGIAILLGSAVTFIFPLLFLLIMNFVFVPYEEEKLEAVFGDEFVSYKQSVYRWLNIPLKPR